METRQTVVCRPTRGEAVLRPPDLKHMLASLGRTVGIPCPIGQFINDPNLGPTGTAVKDPDRHPQLGGDISGPGYRHAAEGVGHVGRIPPANEVDFHRRSTRSLSERGSAGSPASAPANRTTGQLLASRSRNRLQPANACGKIVLFVRVRADPRRAVRTRVESRQANLPAPSIPLPRLLEKHCQ